MWCWEEKYSTVPASRNFFKQGRDGMLKMDGGGHGGGFFMYEKMSLLLFYTCF